jgi:hypothetical protein
MRCKPYVFCLKWLTHHLILETIFSHYNAHAYTHVATILYRMNVHETVVLVCVLYYIYINLHSN